MPAPGTALITALSFIRDIVTQVKLNNVTFVCPVMMFSFLSSLSQLQYLELSGVGFHENTEYSLPGERTFDGVPLSTLRITMAPTAIIRYPQPRGGGNLPFSPRRFWDRALPGY